MERSIVPSTLLAHVMASNPDATVTVSRRVFESVVLKERILTDAIDHGELKITGNTARVTGLIDVLDFESGFPLVTP